MPACGSILAHMVYNQHTCSSCNGTNMWAEHVLDQAPASLEQPGTPPSEVLQHDEHPEKTRRGEQVQDGKWHLIIGLQPSAFLKQTRTKKVSSTTSSMMRSRLWEAPPAPPAPAPPPPRTPLLPPWCGLGLRRSPVMRSNSPCVEEGGGSAAGAGFYAVRLD